jgi:molybdopterin-synthase adenylyltransferase
VTEGRFSRQSFLGPNGQAIIEMAKVGVVGLGGGGSHIVQQLAHIGFLNYALYDADVMSPSNLNRLVGASEQDVANRTPKVKIAERVVKNVRSVASVDAHSARWQDEPEALRLCDIVFGCVDTFSGRRELETLCRRYLIPYLDIGMDVHICVDEAPRMAGQVILSLPGGLCMSCMGFLNERNLAAEALRYGDVGDMPQVVWANGTLASTAVGIGVDLLTGWSSVDRVIYLSFDGNDGTLKPHVRLKYILSEACLHFPADQVGDPVFRAAGA